MTEISAQYYGMKIRIAEGDSVNREFFGFCANGEFRLQRCCACNLLRYPPTTACPWCADSSSSWEKVDSTGTIYSYTEVQHAIQPELARHTPYAVLIVELDAQKDLPTVGYALRVVGNLVDRNGILLSGESLNSFRIGSRVSMVFTPIAEGISLPQWIQTEEMA